MTIKELDEQIEEKKFLEKNTDEYKAYQFIRETIKDNSLDTIINFLKLDIWEYIKCDIYLFSENKNIEEISYMIDSCKEFFISLSEDTTRTLLGFMILMNRNHKLQDVINYLKTNSFTEEIKCLRELRKESSQIALILMNIKNKDTSINLIPYLEFFKENEKEAIESINFYLVRECINDDIEKHIKVIANREVDEKEIEFHKEIAIRKLFNDRYKLEDILERLKHTKDYLERYGKKRRKKEKEWEEVDSFKEKLEKELEKKEIKVYHDFGRRIKDDDLAISFLTIIKEHNEDYLQELIDVKSNLEKDNIKIKEAILSRYGVSIDKIDLNQLSFSKEELLEILKLLELLELREEEIIFVLENTSMSIIKQIKEWMNRRILPASFFSKRISIMNQKSNQIEFIRDNLEVLKKYNISIETISLSFDILLIEKDLLEKNLSLLERENLLSMIEDKKDYFFIMDSSLEEKINLLKRISKKELLEEDITLLNEEELYRLEVIQELGIEISSIEEIRKLLNKKNRFFLTREESQEVLRRYK